VFRSETVSEKNVKTIGQVFAEDVKLLDSGRQAAEEQVAQDICEIFDAKGDMIECEKVVTKWYASLDPGQRDAHKCGHEDAARFLTRLADQTVNFTKKVVELLPMDYDFGAVSEWTSLHIKDYSAKLKQAKTEIEKIKPTVIKPEVADIKPELREEDKCWVKLPEGGSGMIYTTDGTDPRTSSSRQKVDSDFDFSEFLKKKPSVKIRVRAIDPEGNHSDEVKLELVSKERKYEIQENMLGEATFKCPNDTEGLAAVLKSVISYGVKKSLLSTEWAQRLNGELGVLNAECKKTDGIENVGK